MRLLRRGAENRHVGETRLNRESSRSHSVFTCVVERNMSERVGDDDGGGSSGIAEAGSDEVGRNGARHVGSLPSTMDRLAWPGLLQPDSWAS